MMNTTIGLQFYLFLVYLPESIMIIILSIALYFSNGKD